MRYLVFNLGRGPCDNEGGVSDLELMTDDAAVAEAKARGLGQGGTGQLFDTETGRTVEYWERRCDSAPCERSWTIKPDGSWA